MSNHEKSSVDKEFIPCEEALALKELGFDEPCFGYYGELNGGEIEFFIKKNFDNKAYYVLAPLKSQFFKWVRDKYGYGIQSDTWINGGVKNFRFDIMYPKIYVLQIFETYEEAEDACINKIIELLKLK